MKNKQINKYEAMDMLVLACPSFSAELSEIISYNQPDRLVYIELASLARHLCSLYLNGDTTEFANVFDVVEKLHIDGTDFVKEAATVGFLEAIQIECSHTTKIDDQIFEKFLHPVSLKWWFKLKDFWKKGTLMTDTE